MEQDIGRVSDDTRLSSSMEPEDGLHPPGFDPSRNRKIKGFTEQQTHALLWCGTRWRRIRSTDDVSRAALQSRALRPYVEVYGRENRFGHKVSARLSDDGVRFLADLGVTDPPYFRTGGPDD